jgi:hypothetical protein
MRNKSSEPGFWALTSRYRAIMGVVDMGGSMNREVRSRN